MVAFFVTDNYHSFLWIARLYLLNNSFLSYSKAVIALKQIVMITMCFII
ncbi:MAG: hypothetical protein ACI9OE_000943 [Mariniflexile sp.]|jgi:hypothetical protein